MNDIVVVRHIRFPCCMPLNFRYFKSFVVDIVIRNVHKKKCYRTLNYIPCIRLWYLIYNLSKTLSFRGKICQPFHINIRDHTHRIINKIKICFFNNCHFPFLIFSFLIRITLMPSHGKM